MSKIFSVLLILFFSFFSLSTPAAAQQAWTGVCVGKGAADDVATLQGVQCLIANVLNVVMTAFAFVGFVMFIYGALTWMFAGGQTSNVEKARSTFTSAIFGLILALSSYVIIQLITVFTGIQGLLSIKFLGNSLPSSIQSIGSELEDSESTGN